MKNTYFLLSAFLFLMACTSSKESTKSISYKIPVYAWVSDLNSLTDTELKTKFEFYKNKGIDVLMYHGGHDPLTYQRVGKIAKEAGLGLDAWIPTMVQNKTPEISSDWYAVNRNGESALEKPAYVAYYKFL